MEAETTKFSNWLREARIARGLTGEGLAELIESASPVISNLESGKRNPSPEMVDRIARGLVPAFLEGDEAEEAYKRLRSAGRFAAFMPEEEKYASRPETTYDPLIEEMEAARNEGAVTPDEVLRYVRALRMMAQEEKRNEVATPSFVTKPVKEIEYVNEGYAVAAADNDMSADESYDRQAQEIQDRHRFGSGERPKAPVRPVDD